MGAARAGLAEPTVRVRHVRRGGRRERTRVRGRARRRAARMRPDAASRGCRALHGARSTAPQSGGRSGGPAAGQGDGGTSGTAVGRDGTDTTPTCGRRGSGIASGGGWRFPGWLGCALRHARRTAPCPRSGFLRPAALTKKGCGRDCRGDREDIVRGADGRRRPLPQRKDSMLIAPREIDRTLAFDFFCPSVRMGLQTAVALESVALLRSVHTDVCLPPGRAARVLERVAGPRVANRVVESIPAERIHRHPQAGGRLSGPAAPDGC